MNQSEHDMLIRIDENVKNLVEKHTSHIKDDAARFSSLETKVSWLSGRYWLGYGIFLVLLFGAKAILHF